MIAILFSILPILWVQKIEASVLVADTTMSRMVELNADAPFCALYNDRGVIQRMVLGADPRKVRQISSNLVADLEETCKASQNKGKVRHLFPRKCFKLLSNSFFIFLNFIFKFLYLKKVPFYEMIIYLSKFIVPKK